MYQEQKDGTLFDGNQNYQPKEGWIQTPLKSKLNNDAAGY